MIANVQRSRSTGRARRASWVAAVAVGTLLAGLAPGVAAAATGGPDGGGYSFTDSTEAGGPAAGPFTSIAGSGTELDDHGDETMTAVDLPFPVTLYDVAESLLLDGAIMVSPGAGNREGLVIPVYIEASDTQIAADYGTTLDLEASKRSNTLAFYPGDGYGPATVLETFPALANFG